MKSLIVFTWYPEKARSWLVLGAYTESTPLLLDLSTEHVVLPYRTFTVHTETHMTLKCQKNKEEGGHNKLLNVNT